MLVRIGLLGVTRRFPVLARNVSAIGPYRRRHVVAARGTGAAASTAGNRRQQQRAAHRFAAADGNDDDGSSSDSESDSDDDDEDDGPREPWNTEMDDDQFAFMRDILAAPSPVGFEAAMTRGVLEPAFDRVVADGGEGCAGWGTRFWAGNASVALDTAPDDDSGKLKVMVCGHSDKIRMQVRHVASDGKVYIDSDSFLPLTLIGNEVVCFARTPPPPAEKEDKKGKKGKSKGKRKGSSPKSDFSPSAFTRIEGGTVEALGAIHFAPASFRTGGAGIKPGSLYLELGLHGKKRKEQVEALGIQPGDPVLLDRPIKRSKVSPLAFSGAYLDNGLGCFVAAEVARLLADHVRDERGGAPLEHVRCMFAAASHEEIGRFGSRVLAADLKPDVLVAVDVNHDYSAAPGKPPSSAPPLAMGKGVTITGGSVTSSQLNGMIQGACEARGIPFQLDTSGRDTGTDAMAGVLGNVDAAATSLGFPIRNMHTVSETGHTGDVLAAAHAVFELVKRLEADGTTRADFVEGHARLDAAAPVDRNEADD